MGASKETGGALAGVAWWIVCWPEGQGVAGLIPSQGTHLGYGPVPQLGACERQLIDVSLSHIDDYLLLLPPFPLSKNKEINSLKKYRNGRKLLQTDLIRKKREG